MHNGALHHGAMRRRAPTRTRSRISMRRLAAAALASLVSLAAAGCRRPDAVALRPDGLPAWTANVGARSRPAAARECSPNALGAVGDGATKSTAAIQRAID